MEETFGKIYEAVRKSGFYNVIGKLETFIIKKAIDESPSVAAAGRKIGMERTTLTERTKRYGIKKNKQGSLQADSERGTP